MHRLIEDLNWRYATKKFDSAKKVSEENLNTIKESLRLVPTSYGLQSMKHLIIESPALRAQLAEASYGQAQVVEASHLLVLCVYTNITEQHIDTYAQNISSMRKQEVSELEGYANFMKRTITAMTPEHQLEWNRRQVYIALGQLLTTCAELRIDATPMEGFDVNRYNEILGLQEKNLTAVLVCPIGYRHSEDLAQHQTKVRKSIEDLFEIIQ